MVPAGIPTFLTALVVSAPCTDQVMARELSTIIWDSMIKRTINLAREVQVILPPWCRKKMFLETAKIISILSMLKSLRWSITTNRWWMIGYQDLNSSKLSNSKVITAVKRFIRTRHSHSRDSIRTLSIDHLKVSRALSNCIDHLLWATAWITNREWQVHLLTTCTAIPILRQLDLSMKNEYNATNINILQ